jgi:hypothetical protein
MRSKFAALSSAITPIIIMLIGVAAYLGFYPLFQMFQSGAIKELLAAIFGALVVTFITLLQLRQQTSINEEKEKQTQIFKEKLEIFKEYLSLVQEIILKAQQNKDKYLEAEKNADTVKIIFLLSRLRLHCEIDVVNKIGHNLYRLTEQMMDDSTEQGTSYAVTIDYLFATCEIFRAELFEKDNQSLRSSDYLDMDNIQTTMRGIRSALANANAVDQPPPTNTLTDPPSVHPLVYYVNLGGRSWDDMRKYGFWQAGGTDRTISGMKRIPKGAIVCAYSSGDGYVGIGIVRAGPIKFSSFEVIFEGKQRLLADVGDAITRKFLPGGERFNHDMEYVLEVDWQANTLRSKQDAARRSGLFAAPMTSCRLTDKSTLEFLSSELNFNFTNLNSLA